MESCNSGKSIVIAEMGKISDEVNTLHMRLKTFMSHMSGIVKEFNQAGTKLTVYSNLIKVV